MKTKKATRRKTIVRCSPLRAPDKDVQSMVGKTMDEIRHAVENMLSVPPNAPCVIIRGRKSYPAPAKYHLKDGDVLEYQRPASTKCSVVKCGLCKNSHCLEHGECA
jgi:hypothetical protein